MRKRYKKRTKKRVAKKSALVKAVNASNRNCAKIVKNIFG